MEVTSQIAATETQTAPIQPLDEKLPTVVEWLPDSLLPLWEVIAQFPIFQAAIVASVFFAFALVIRLVIFRSLVRLSIMTSSLVDDHILQHMRKPVFVTVMYFGLSLAVTTAQLPFGTQLIVKLLLSLIVVSWMVAALRISTVVLDTLGTENKYNLIEPRTVPLLDLSVKLITILVSGYILLLIWGINPVGWLASAGIVGIAVGFAAKDSLANLFSGFFIVADAPYKLGDYINLDTGERGKVSAIGLRSTRLLTRADVEITIPNGVIANAKIVNESGGPNLKMRVSIAVGVAYGTDLDRLCDVLTHLAVAHQEVCIDPEPKMRLRGFGPSSVDFDLLVWIEQPEDKGRISHELYMKIYKTLGDQDIEIPYSKQDIYIKELPGDSSK
jgi:MscS family membrane protein